MSINFELICADSFNEKIKIKLEKIYDDEINQLFILNMKSYGFHLEIIKNDLNIGNYLTIYKIPKMLVNKFWRDQNETIILIRELVDDVFQLCFSSQKKSYLNTNENFKFSQIPKQLLEVCNNES